MRPLKIGIVTQSYYPHFGGVTEHAHHMALALMRRGHSVTVMTGGPDVPPPCPSPRVIRWGRTVLIPSNGARATVALGLGLGRWMKRTLRSEGFDLVSCQCPLRPTLPLAAIRHSRCPVIGTFHATAGSSIGYAVFRRPLAGYHSRLAGRIAVSEPAREFASRYFPGRYKIIPNGVDTERFSPTVSPLERFGDGAFNVLYVGRLDPRKGLPVLVASFRELWAGHGDGVRLIIVGDGPLRGRIKRAIPGEIRRAVHVEGPVPHDLLPSYYASSHALCSPATGGESFGIVLLEAMASGVPVVASDIPGYRTAVKNGVHGLLVAPGSEHSLAGALDLLARDESLREKMGAAGRENAKSYSWERIVLRMEEYFREVVEGEAPGRGADGARRGALASKRS